MDNGHKWPWKFPENSCKEVLESHGKPLFSVLCAPCNTDYVEYGVKCNRSTVSFVIAVCPPV